MSTVTKRADGSVISIENKGAGKSYSGEGFNRGGAGLGAYTARKKDEKAAAKAASTPAPRTTPTPSPTPYIKSTLDEGLGSK